MPFKIDQVFSRMGEVYFKIIHLHVYREKHLPNRIFFQYVYSLMYICYACEAKKLYHKALKNLKYYKQILNKISLKYTLWTILYEIYQ
jgi:hypothetical protein